MHRLCQAVTAQYGLAWTTTVSIEEENYYNSHALMCLIKPNRQLSSNPISFKIT